MSIQFLKINDVAWNGQSKLVKARSGELLALFVTTHADEDGVRYLHFYDVAAAEDIAAGNHVWCEPLTPNYYNAFDYGSQFDFENGMALKITKTAAKDGSGDDPDNNVIITGRYR